MYFEPLCCKQLFLDQESNMTTGSWTALSFVIVCFVQSTYSDSGQPNVLITDCPKYVREGNNLSCTCQTTDYTENTGEFSPYWKEQNGSAQLGKNNVSRHDNGTVFTCAMKWGDDEVTMNYTLLVAYGPEKAQVLGPSTFITNGSQDITLTCNTTGSYPEASCNWGNVKCHSLNPTPTCIFKPRGRYDEGRNISCYAFNKESGTYSATDVFTLRLHYPPELAPQITARRKVNITTVDIVTCTVTGGHPQVSFVNLTCDDTRNASYSDDLPETDQTDVVFTSIVFALVGPRTVSCTCQGVWSPQQDMYQHVVNASFYFSHEKRHPPLDLLMAVIIGCLTFVALIAVCVFTAVLCKRLKTEHVSDILEKECNVDNQINHYNVKKNKESSSSDCLTPDTPSKDEGCSTPHSDLYETKNDYETEDSFTLNFPSVAGQEEKKEQNYYDLCDIPDGQTAAPSGGQHQESDDHSDIVRSMEKPESETKSALYSILDTTELKLPAKKKPGHLAVPYSIVDVCDQPYNRPASTDSKTCITRPMAAQSRGSSPIMKKEIGTGYLIPKEKEEAVDFLREPNVYNVLRLSNAVSSRSSDYKKVPEVNRKRDTVHDNYSNLSRESGIYHQEEKAAAGDDLRINGNKPLIRPVDEDSTNAECKDSVYYSAESVLSDSIEIMDECQPYVYDESHYNRISLCNVEEQMPLSLDGENVYESLDGTGMSAPQ